MGLAIGKGYRFLWEVIKILKLMMVAYICEYV